MAIREMRDSGVQWIAEIPEDWEAVALKRVATLNDDSLSNNISDDYQFNYVDIGSVSFEKGVHSKELTTFKEAPSRARRLVRKNDVIISTVRTYLKAIAIISDEEQLVVSTGFAVIRPRKLYPLFLNYAVKSHYFTERVRAYSNGVAYPSINASELISMKVVLPNIEEQQKIAAFLDEKVSHIDNIIEDTKKSIRDLKIYKQSFITEVVTKGLDSTVEMQDSGVEYIGKIPSHWKFSKFKYLLNSPLKYGANESGVAYDDNKPRYIRITDILEGNKLINSNRQSLDEDIAEEYILKDGDLLFARSGATAGKTYMVTKKTPRSAFAGYLIKGDVGDVDVSNYVYYYTLSKSYEEWKNSVVIQATIQNIGAEKYANMFLPIPPKDEQIDIVKYLNKKVESIDLILEDKRLLLSEFESYKKSLIYEYVTGKKEVK